MNLRLLGIACVASLSLSFGSGCIGNCDPANSQDAPPSQFQASSVEAVRSPATCGEASPPFTDQDTFLLDVTGETTVPPPYNTLSLVVTRTIPLNQPFALNMSATASGPTAELEDPAIAFTYSVGSTPAEIDTSALDAVVITVTTMPTADGQPLGATLQLFFLDGTELDQPFGALLKTAGCTPPAPASSVR